jgi:hypothetical protein
MTSAMRTIPSPISSQPHHGIELLDWVVGVVVVWVAGIVTVRVRVDVDGVDTVWVSVSVCVWVWVWVRVWVWVTVLVVGVVSVDVSVAARTGCDTAHARAAAATSATASLVSSLRACGERFMSLLQPPAMPGGVWTDIEWPSDRWLHPRPHEYRLRRPRCRQ